MARRFSEFLGEVEHGRSIQILKGGRAVARLIPDFGFMDGAKAADLFKGYCPDGAAADAIERELTRVKEDEDSALAH